MQVADSTGIYHDAKNAGWGKESKCRKHQIRATPRRYELSAIQARVDDPFLTEPKVTDAPHTALLRIDFFRPLECAIPGCRHIVDRTSARR
jgi:hypothetical protein